MKLIIRAFFSLLVLGVGLVVLELVFLVAVKEQPIGKMWIQTQNSWGHCYASDPEGYYPISLRESAADREKLDKQLLWLDDGVERPNVAQLQDVAPHCIVYTDHRTNGFFPRRKVTVALVGDSFTYGEAIRDKDTLGYLLGKKYSRFNFINHGMPGINIRTVHEHILGLLSPPLEVRRIIYFFNPNDVMGAADNPITVESLPAMSEDSGHAAGLSERLLAFSNIARMIQGVQQRHRVGDLYVQGVLQAYVDPQLKKERQETEALLVSMKREHDRRKARLLVVIYPFLYKDIWGRYPLSAAHEWVLSLCQKHSIHCIDGSEAFAAHYFMNRLQANPSDSHPNGRANRAMVSLVDLRARDFFDPAR